MGKIGGQGPIGSPQRWGAVVAGGRGAQPSVVGVALLTQGKVPLPGVLGQGDDAGGAVLGSVGGFEPGFNRNLIRELKRVNQLDSGIVRLNNGRRVDG